MYYPWPCQPWSVRSIPKGRHEKCCTLRHQMRALLVICLCSSQPVRVSKVLHTSVGILGLQRSAFSEEKLDAACFSISVYWILELQKGHECSWKIFPSTKLQKRRPPCCAGSTVFVAPSQTRSGLAERNRGGHGSREDGISSLKWHNCQI